MKLPLGSKAKDDVTGFSGVVTGYCYDLTAKDQVAIQPPLAKDGAFRERQWFDADRVSEVKAAKPARKRPAPANKAAG